MPNIAVFLFAYWTLPDQDTSELKHFSTINEVSSILTLCSALKLLCHTVKSIDSLICKLVYSFWHNVHHCDNAVAQSFLCSATIY